MNVPQTLCLRINGETVPTAAVLHETLLTVLRDREYVRLDKKRLVPEDKGRLVTAFLESFFKRYVEYDFTADLEEKLDLISDNKMEWRQVLRDFWRDFMVAVDGIKELRVGDVMEALNELLGPHIFPVREDGGDPRQCPACGTGRLSLKPSRFGPFIGCSNYSEGTCSYTRQLSQNADDPNAGLDGKVLGYSDDGEAVTLKMGRFGAYVQLGEGSDDEKPKRSSLPKGVEAANVDLEYALKLLSLPRLVGEHPEGGSITAGLGRYGPFVLHENGDAKTYANLESIEDVFSIGLNRAVTVIAEKKAGGGKGRFNRSGPKVLADLGAHPTEGGPIQVLDGRYGPYIAHNKVYANVPKGTEPTAVTVDQAVALLAERAAKGPSKKVAKKAAAKPKAKPKGDDDAKPAAKKAPAKKAAAKKAPAKKAAPAKRKVSG